MYVVVKKITGIDLMRWACSMTTDSESRMTLPRIYKNEHSPMRTQMFAVSMYGIPGFVHVHFRAHKQGIEHYVKTLRDDRGGTGKEDRWTPTNHGMLLNAQALINLSRKRLCYKAHDETRKVMILIRDSVKLVDPDLYERMVPDCVYRNCCHEDKPCGYFDTYSHPGQIGC